MPIYPACDAQALYCYLWTVQFYILDENKFIYHKIFVLIFSKILSKIFLILRRNDGYTEWRTKCHTIDCARNTFLLLQKHLLSGTELILLGWKIVPNEEHVGTTVLPHNLFQTNACIRHNFSTQVFRKGAAQHHYLGPELRYTFWPPFSGLLWRLSEDLCRKVVTNARVRLQEVVK